MKHVGAHFFQISGAKIFGNGNPEAHAASHAEAQHEKLHAAAGSHTGQVITAQHLPHNGRIDNIIRLLQQVSRQQRQCKRKHQLQRTALCHGCRHVFTSYHFIAGFYDYRLFYHQCPAPAMNRFASALFINEWFRCGSAPTHCTETARPARQK